MKQNLLPYTATSLRAWQEQLVIKTWITTHQLTTVNCRDVIIRVTPAIRHCRLIGDHRLHNQID